MDTSSRTPWYQRTRRWGQTNLTEIDPQRIDIDWWRRYWRKTNVQGVIVNAGGIVAYYPSRFEHHYRAAHLGDRDLFGEIVAAARAQKLSVLARMDSNRADEPFYRIHPDWFAVDATGKAYRAGDRYLACINGPYYRQYLPEVLKEIIERYHPDGFTDNSWTGAGRKTICYCNACRKSFGSDLPAKPDWNDPAYRKWIRWSYTCRTELWDLNNRITRECGGEHCLWLGMLHGDPVSSHLSFCDLVEIGRRSLIVMTDQQGREHATGFEQNSLTGRVLHGVAGWDKIIPESMAMYVRGEQAFRVAANPAEEARTWMMSGFAGGISPWWHHVSAAMEDRRQFETAPPLLRWHKEHEELLYNREPIANVGIVWSHQNTDFYGRDDARTRVQFPWRGFTWAMTQARIPFIALNIGQVAQSADKLDVLILPDLAALSDEQAQCIRRFVESGGSIIATGRTSLLDEWGQPRNDFALADILGIHWTGKQFGVDGEPSSSWEVTSGHNYLRLDRNEARRHPVVKGFRGTDIVGMGGTLQEVRPGRSAQVAATYVPSFPIYPPEFAWMRQPSTDIPAIITSEHASGGRIVYFADDIDRAFARRGLPDHACLLTNAIRWAAKGKLPFTIEGPGYIDCHLYRQEGQLLLHLVNLSGLNQWPGYVQDRLPVGPLEITLRVSQPGRWQVRAVDSGRSQTVQARQGAVHFTVERLTDHEILVISPATRRPR